MQVKAVSTCSGTGASKESYLRRSGLYLGGLRKNCSEQVAPALTCVDAIPARKLFSCGNAERTCSEQLGTGRAYGAKSAGQRMEKLFGTVGNSFWPRLNALCSVPVPIRDGTDAQPSESRDYKMTDSELENTNACCMEGIEQVTGSKENSYALMLKLVARICDELAEDGYSVLILGFSGVGKTSALGLVDERFRDERITAWNGPRAHYPTETGKANGVYYVLMGQPLHVSLHRDIPADWKDIAIRDGVHRDWLSGVKTVGGGS
ncbi:hypothetical protein [Mycolicibacterium mageritense]|uniref:hypothetical protein n=1 Tax=Mycolicibacterium mageritense TaxID=53462 RepID=UPI001E4422C5|nr:hypothetical protein [Mycolicibacterium mageritense]MCC9186423.1 hypothetical protein [Mycolicibacterium mageritense]